MIFKRIFKRDSKASAAPAMRGFDSPMTGVQQDAMRASMEAEVSADRKRRGATDTRPGEKTAP